MLPRGLTRIAIVPANTLLHAQTVAKYSPYCEVSGGCSAANLAVFMGYNQGMAQIVKMYKAKSVPTVCWWIGSDVEMFINVNPKPDDVLLYDYHVSTCKAQHDKLLACGIETEIQPVVPAWQYPVLKLDVNYEGLQKFFPPLKKKVLIYMPIGRFDMPISWGQIKTALVGDTYCSGDMVDIVEACPDVLFTIFGNACNITDVPPNVIVAGRADQNLVHNIYADNDILIRKTTHGEIAQSVVEAKQSGCMVICNHELPHTVFANTVDEFIKAISETDTNVDFAGSEYYTKEYHPDRVLDLWSKYIKMDSLQSVAIDYEMEMNKQRGAL